MCEENPEAARVAALFGLSADSPQFLTATTHPSYAHEVAGAQDNQRLEFLGDAILDFVISEELYRRFPDSDEGKLTRTRAQLVSTGALARFAREHQLSAALRFGKGAGQGSLHESDNVLADAVEALLAAAYLDRGADEIRRLGVLILEFGLSAIEKAGARDAKSELQEKVQALGFRAPIYRVVASHGPAHESVFDVEVSVDGRVLAAASGRSKRVAEREAAKKSLDEEVLGALAASRAESLEPEVQSP